MIFFFSSVLPEKQLQRFSLSHRGHPVAHPRVTKIVGRQSARELACMVVPVRYGHAALNPVGDVSQIPPGAGLS